MKTLLTTAAVALTLTAASAAFAGTAPNRGQGLVRSLDTDRTGYALTGDHYVDRKATPAPDRHPVQDQIARGRGAF